MHFLSIKTSRFRKIGVRPDFLGSLGYPTMEKNNKTYKNSGPPKEGLQGTTLPSRISNVVQQSVLTL